MKKNIYIYIYIYTHTHIYTHIRQPGGWAKAKTLHSEEDKFDLDKLREQCPKPVDIDLMYSFGKNSGLPLQKRFRTVRQCQTGDMQSFARLEMEKDCGRGGKWCGHSWGHHKFHVFLTEGLFGYSR